VGVVKISKGGCRRVLKLAGNFGRENEAHGEALRVRDTTSRRRLKPGSSVSSADEDKKSFAARLMGQDLKQKGGWKKTKGRVIEEKIARERRKSIAMMTSDTSE